MTRTWRVYGRDGHRQAQAFGKSEIWDFRNGDYARPVVMEIRREDQTGTLEYVELAITAPDRDACLMELQSQVSDGLLENSRTGKITEFADGGWVEVNLY